MAAADADDAVRFLLGRTPELWKSIAEAETVARLSDITGEIENFAEPLVAGFSLRRDVATRIKQQICGGAQVVALTGPPISGKTNVLAEFARMGDQQVFPFLSMQHRCNKESGSTSRTC